MKPLSEEEIYDLLEKKWISPIITAINNVGEDVIVRFVSNFTALEKKYSDPLAELSGKIDDINAELKVSLNELTGNDIDMAAVTMLLEEL